MATRITCFIIAIVFLVTFLSYLFLVIWSANEESRENDEKISQLNDIDYGTLDNFTPIVDQVDFVEIATMSSGEGELTALSTDTVTFDYDLAFAYNGEIIATSDEEKIQASQEQTDEEEESNSTNIVDTANDASAEDLSVTIGMLGLDEKYQEIIIGLKEGGHKRVIIPEADIDDYSIFWQNQILDFPTGTDYILDIKLRGISQRQGLDDFKTILSPPSEVEVKNVKITEGDARIASESDLAKITFKPVFAESNILIDQIDIRSLEIDLSLSSNSQWNDLIIGMKLGSVKRLILPPNTLGQYLAGQPLPEYVSEKSIVIEFELLNVFELTEIEAGLKFNNIKIGSGKQIKVGDTARFKYEGRLLSNGKIFDASDDEGIEKTLKEGEVISGWVKGIDGMKEGGSRILYIPSEFAYGQTGFGDIPPGANLIFDVELLEVLELSQEVE